MKAAGVIVLGASIALALSQGGFVRADAQSQTSTQQSVRVTLKAQNGSGEDGTATLIQQGSSLTVKISVKNGTTTPQPAHIHLGTCAKLGDVKYPLANVVSGTSTTTLKGVTLASLQTGGFAINLHKSTSDLGTYVACGQIPTM